MATGLRAGASQVPRVYPRKPRGGSGEAACNPLTTQRAPHYGLGRECQRDQRGEAGGSRPHTNLGSGPMNPNPIQQLPGPSPANVLESSGEQKMPVEGYFQERQK